MGVTIRRFDICEIGDTWEDKGFKLVNYQNGVLNAVNRKVFDATQDKSLVTLSLNGRKEILSFDKGADILVGETSLSYRSEQARMAQ